MKATEIGTILKNKLEDLESFFKAGHESSRDELIKLICRIQDGTPYKEALKNAYHDYLDLKAKKDTITDIILTIHGKIGDMDQEVNIFEVYNTFLSDLAAQYPKLSTYSEDKGLAYIGEFNSIYE